LKIPRLEKITVALGIELKELLGVDEKITFHASFHNQSGCQSSYQNESFYVNSAKEMAHELETSRLTVEQKEREIELLREQVGQLKEIIELMRK
jgi:endonuclease IV